MRVNAGSKHTLATVFEDEELIAKYIETNRANLRRSLGVIASVSAEVVPNPSASSGANPDDTARCQFTIKIQTAQA